MMKRKISKILITLVGILILVCILAGGTYYFKRKDETAKWKVYKGDQYSFRYPSTWSEKPKIAWMADASSVFESPDIKYDDVDGVRVEKGSYVFVYLEPTDKTLDQLEQEVRNYKTPPQTDAPQVLKVERMKLGDLDILKEIATIGPNALTYTTVYKGKKIVASCNYIEKEAGGLANCEKILATFRLLPPKESLEISWQFDDMGEDSKTGGRLTNVTVILKGKINKTFALGTYLGECSQMVKPNQFSPNEIAGVVCWWAGGTEIGVFRENERLMVKTRELIESPEYPPSEKDFKQILEIK
jgi:hypothetical protein